MKRTRGGIPIRSTATMLRRQERQAMMLNNIPFLQRLFGEPLRRVQRWYRSRARRAMAWISYQTRIRVIDEISRDERDYLRRQQEQERAEQEFYAAHREFFAAHPDMLNIDPRIPGNLLRMMQAGHPSLR